MRAEAVTGPVAGHGEGPAWDAAAGALRWVDLLAGDLLTLEGDDVVRRHVGDVAAAWRPRAGGGLVVAVERGFVLVEPDGTVGPVHAAFDDPDVRMNDGACDRAGRFFCGSMAYAMDPGRAALYRFEADGTVGVALTGLTISNGLAWTADGATAVFVDSPTQRVDLLDYDAEAGTFSGRRPMARVDPDHGMPDGLALDVDGGVWVALWGGGAVHRYTADGRLDAVVEVPVRQVTACAFGGPDGDRLYITTSDLGLGDDAEPAAGALFAVDPGVRGLPVATFGG